MNDPQTLARKGNRDLQHGRRQVQGKRQLINKHLPCCDYFVSIPSGFHSTRLARCVKTRLVCALTHIVVWSRCYNLKFGNFKFLLFFVFVFVVVILTEDCTELF